MSDHDNQNTERDNATLDAEGLKVVTDKDNLKEAETPDAAFQKTGKTPVDVEASIMMSQKLAFKEANPGFKSTDPELEPNILYIQFYCFVLGLGVFQTSMSFAGTTQTIPLIAEKFEWGEDVKFYNTIITSAGILGLSLGSLLGGKTITIGRRKSAIIMQLIALVGAIATQYLHVWTLCLGRLLYGFAAGHLNIIMAKSINETIPASVRGQFGIATNAYLRVGIMLIFFLGIILPDEPQEMVDDNIRWRIIFSVPFWVAILQILCWLLFVRQEPIGFNIANNNDEGAKDLLKRVYKQGELTDEEFEKAISNQLSHLNRTTSKESSLVTFNQAVCGPKYRKATWVCCILNFMNQQSGIGIVTVYATRLLIIIKEQTEGQFPISPLVGTIVIGVACAVFAILGAFVVKMVGRRKILIIGSMGMALCMGGTGAAIHFQWYLTAYLMLIGFIFFFNVSTGNVAFIYAAEVTVDQASGIVMFFFFASLCVLAFSAEYLIYYLKAQGTFWLFGGLNFLGFLFCLIWIKETMGLTDAEQKVLYTTSSSQIMIGEDPDLKTANENDPNSIQ